MIYFCNFYANFFLSTTQSPAKRLSGSNLYVNNFLYQIELKQENRFK